MNRTYLRYFNVERAGASAHFWAGPVGVHIFRRLGGGLPVAFDWRWGIWR